LSELATEVKRQHAEITVLDAAGEVVCSWGLTDAYPVKWTGPSLDAGGRQVAFETLELAHNGFLEG
jgi:phage tail-like protein